MKASSLSIPHSNSLSHHSQGSHSSQQAIYQQQKQQDEEDQSTTSPSSQQITPIMQLQQKEQFQSNLFTDSPSYPSGSLDSIQSSQRSSLISDGSTSDGEDDQSQTEDDNDDTVLCISAEELGEYNYSYYEDRGMQYFVLPGDFVVTERGTGFVEACVSYNPEQLFVYKEMIKQSKQPKEKISYTKVTHTIGLRVWMRALVHQDGEVLEMDLSQMEENIQLFGGNGDQGHEGYEELVNEQISHEDYSTDFEWNSSFNMKCPVNVPGYNEKGFMTAETTLAAYKELIRKEKEEKDQKNKRIKVKQDEKLKQKERERVQDIERSEKENKKLKEKKNNQKYNQKKEEKEQQSLSQKFKIFNPIKESNNNEFFKERRSGKTKLLRLPIHHEDPLEAAAIQRAKAALLQQAFTLGTIADGPCKGMALTQARDVLKQNIINYGGGKQIPEQTKNDRIQYGNQLGFIYFEPSKPTQSVYGDECVVRLTRQWTLQYSQQDWRDKSTVCLLQMNIQDIKPSSQIMLLAQFGKQISAAVGGSIPLNSQNETNTNANQTNEQQQGNVQQPQAQQQVTGGNIVQQDETRLQLFNFLANAKDKVLTHNNGLGCKLNLADDGNEQEEKALGLDPEELFLSNDDYSEYTIDPQLYQAMSMLLFPIAHILNNGIQSKDTNNTIYKIQAQQMTSDVWDYIFCCSDDHLEAKKQLEQNRELRLQRMKEREKLGISITQNLSGSLNDKFTKSTSINSISQNSEEYELNVKSQPEPLPHFVLEELRSEFLYWYPSDIRVISRHQLSQQMLSHVFHHAQFFVKADQQPKGLRVLGEMIIDEEQEKQKKQNQEYSNSPLLKEIDSKFHVLLMKHPSDALRIAFVCSRWRFQTNNISYIDSYATDIIGVLNRELQWMENIFINKILENVDYFDKGQEVKIVSRDGNTDIFSEQSSQIEEYDQEQELKRKRDKQMLYKEKKKNKKKQKKQKSINEDDDNYRSNNLNIQGSPIQIVTQNQVMNIISVVDDEFDRNDRISIHTIKSQENLNIGKVKNQKDDDESDDEYSDEYSSQLDEDQSMSQQDNADEIKDNKEDIIKNQQQNQKDEDEDEQELNNDQYFEDRITDSEDDNKEQDLSFYFSEQSEDYSSSSFSHYQYTGDENKEIIANAEDIKKQKEENKEKRKKRKEEQKTERQKEIEEEEHWKFEKAIEIKIEEKRKKQKRKGTYDPDLFLEKLPQYYSQIDRQFEGKSVISAFSASMYSNATPQSNELKGDNQIQSPNQSVNRNNQEDQQETDNDCECDYCFVVGYESYLVDDDEDDKSGSFLGIEKQGIMNDYIPNSSTPENLGSIQSSYDEINPISSPSSYGSSPFSISSSNVTVMLLYAAIFRSQINLAILRADKLYLNGEYGEIVQLIFNELRQARNNYEKNLEITRTHLRHLYEQQMHNIESQIEDLKTNEQDEESVKEILELQQQQQNIEQNFREVINKSNPEMGLLRRYAYVIIALLSPICPHWSEHIYYNILHLRDSMRKLAIWPLQGIVDEKLLKVNAFLVETIDLVRKTLKGKMNLITKRRRKRQTEADKIRLNSNKDISSQYSSQFNQYDSSSVITQTDSSYLSSTPQIPTDEADILPPRTERYDPMIQCDVCVIVVANGYSFAQLELLEIMAQQWSGNEEYTGPGMSDIQMNDHGINLNNNIYSGMNLQGVANYSNFQIALNPNYNQFGGSILTPNFSSGFNLMGLNTPQIAIITPAIPGIGTFNNLQRIQFGFSGYNTNYQQGLWIDNYSTPNQTAGLTGYGEGSFEKAVQEKLIQKNSKISKQEKNEAMQFVKEKKEQAKKIGKKAFEAKKSMKHKLEGRMLRDNNHIIASLARENLKNNSYYTNRPEEQRLRQGSDKLENQQKNNNLRRKDPIKDYISEFKVFVLHQNSHFPNSLDKFPSISKKNRDRIQPGQPLIAIFSSNGDQSIINDLKKSERDS